MKWYLLGILSLVALVSIIGINFFRERRYLRKRTSAVIRDQVQKELEEELLSAKEKQKRFQQALQDAREKISSRTDSP